MARFDQGWFKMFRSVAFGEIGARGNDCLGLWLRLLCMATNRETEVTWGRSLRRIPAGTVVTSIRDLAASDDVRDNQLVRRNLDFLEIRQSIRQETNKRGRLIFLNNWSRYQSLFNDATNVQQSVQPTPNNDATNTRQLIEERRKKERECVTPQDVEACAKTWRGTLTHFGISRDLSPREKEQIARAIQRHGAEAVDLALFGARFETKTENFDPRNHVSLARVLEKDRSGQERIDKFVNLGSQARAQESKRDVVEVQIPC